MMELYLHFPVCLHAKIIKLKDKFYGGIPRLHSGDTLVDSQGVTE
jgi:hypothetical protein